MYLIEGTANPLVTVLFGNAVKVGFDGVASGLKKRAEALHAQRADEESSAPGRVTSR